jgi:hypothetical protein
VRLAAGGMTFPVSVSKWATRAAESQYRPRPGDRGKDAPAFRIINQHDLARANAAYFGLAWIMFSLGKAWTRTLSLGFTK